MKIAVVSVLIGVAGPLLAFQGGMVMPDIGTGPTAFETRNEGGNTDGSVSISGRAPTAKPRKIQLIAVCDSREWRNTDGQIIKASMLAHETNPSEQDKRALTLVRDGKIRLLVDGRKQFSEYPLSKLSVEDQAFVNGLVRARKVAEAAAVEAKAEE